VTAVTGAGPWPGAEPLSAAVTVMGDLTETPSDVEGLPFTPVLVDRGPWSDALGRSVAMLVDLPAEIGVHGWKLTDHAGGDLLRARSFAGQDLDALAVAAHGYEGPLVVPVLGPISLAARVDLAHGDRILSDPAALRDAAESLAAGTPVLVTPVGGLPEAVRALCPQLVLAGAGRRDLAQGIADAVTGALRLPSSEQCRAYAQSRFDWPQIAAQTREVYLEALR